MQGISGSLRLSGREVESQHGEESEQGLSLKIHPSTGWDGTEGDSCRHHLKGLRGLGAGGEVHCCHFSNALLQLSYMLLGGDKPCVLGMVFGLGKVITREHLCSPVLIKYRFS